MENRSLFSERENLMLTLNINGQDYKIAYGYNSFCDTDLMDKTKDLLELIQGSGADNEQDLAAIGKIKDLFICLRELLYVGMEKYNPQPDVKTVGNLLDDYRDEQVEGEKHDLLSLFTLVAGELVNEGFLGDLLSAGQKQTKRSKRLTQPTPAIVEMPVQ